MRILQKEPGAAAGLQAAAGGGIIGKNTQDKETDLMTEQQKCAAGQLYNAEDGAMSAVRAHAKDICWQANRLPPSARSQRNRLLAGLFGGCHDFVIEPSFWCDYGCNIYLGRGFYANHDLVILDCARVTIGDNVLMGPQCGLYTAGHPEDAALRRTGLEYARPITIGDDVWLGGGVRVMPGVTIGAGSIIAGGSVVTHDIPAGVVAAGCPCRVVRPVRADDRAGQTL